MFPLKFKIYLLSLKVIVDYIFNICLFILELLQTFFQSLNLIFYCTDAAVCFRDELGNAFIIRIVMSPVAGKYTHEIAISVALAPTLNLFFCFEHDYFLILVKLVM